MRCRFSFSGSVFCSQIRVAFAVDEFSDSLIKSDELFRFYNSLVERNEPSKEAFDGTVMRLSRLQSYFFNFRNKIRLRAAKVL